MMTIPPDPLPTTVEEAFTRFCHSAGVPDTLPPDAKMALKNAFFAGAVTALRLATRGMTAAPAADLLDDVIDQALIATDDPDQRLLPGAPVTRLARHAAEFIGEEEHAFPAVVNKRVQFFYGGAASFASLARRGGHAMALVNELKSYADARIATQDDDPPKET